MKRKIVQIIFLTGLIVHSAFAVTITKDPGFSTSIMIENFNGAVDPSFGNHSLDFESSGGGLGQYSYAAGGAATEAYASFNSSTAYDPAVYTSIRMRMNSDRSNDEDGDIDVYAFPIQGDGRVRLNNYPTGTTLREASWDLGSVSATTPFSGTGARIDPFNYVNSTGTDYWNVDYIIADIGQSRGAEFDSAGDVDRYLLKNMANTAIVGSLFSGTSTSTDSQIHLNTGIAVVADTYGFVEFKVKADAGSEIKWFWKTDLTDYEGVVLETGAGNDGEWHTYLLDMSDEAGWTGSLTYNRLDPTDQNGANFEVDYARYISSIPEPSTLGLVSFTGGAIILLRRFLLV